LEALKKKVEELLKSGVISGFLGMRLVHQQPYPFLFTQKDLDLLNTLIISDVRYPLAKIILDIARTYTDEKLGIMVRGCDESALFELYKNYQLDPEKIVALGVACSGEQTERCKCPRPNPSTIIVGEKIEVKADRSDLKKIEEMDKKERYDFWMGQLGKCMKCYGCRNICPVCFCEVCTLEHEGLVQRGEIPPEVPNFHLVRAFHMAGRCVDCGLCEEACPANIPLRTLYRKVREIVKIHFNYLPGEDKETFPPLQFLGDGSFEVNGK
jgi:formate dehydrogenase subunit beta